MKTLLPSTVEECLEYMDPQVIIDTRGLSEERVEEIVAEIKRRSEKNGNPSRVYKRDLQSLYVF